MTLGGYITESAGDKGTGDFVGNPLSAASLAPGALLARLLKVLHQAQALSFSLRDFSSTPLASFSLWP